MRTLEMKIAVPEVKGGRCILAEMKDGYILAKFEIGENETSFILESELECRIDPNIFAGTWLEHQPNSRRQKETLDLYQDAKAKGRLHAFTCMTIDPSVRNGKVVYQKGLPIKTGFSQTQWAKMLKDYNPSRNSRQMTRTEYACRNLYLIWKLVESGYKIAEAWKAVCDDSRKIGHYHNSANPKDDFEPTGSREVCGFCDLGNVGKFIAEDPWEEVGTCYAAGGDYVERSNIRPVAYLCLYDFVDVGSNSRVGMIALD